MPAVVRSLGSYGQTYRKKNRKRQSFNPTTKPLNEVYEAI
jgi:hypothetical protein